MYIILVHMVPRGSGKELGLMVWAWSKGLVIRHVWKVVYGVWLGSIELLFKSYPLCELSTEKHLGPLCASSEKQVDYSP